MKSTLAGLLFVPILAVPSLGQTLAFPGAQGHGRFATGGRGGSVLIVDSLADSGPGTLRTALEASGPRTVVFRTGGLIDLTDRIVITSGDLTIAGQTAPGDGVCIRGGDLQILGDNVIVRGLRIRTGDAPDGPSPGNRDCLQILADDVVVDHCSFSWGLDENLSTWAGASRISIQWCIVAEGLFQNPLLFPGDDGGRGVLLGDGSRDVSLHHNLMAHSNGRNPLVKNGVIAEIVNNVAYNWRYEGIGFSVDAAPFVSASSVIGNHLTYGPDSFTSRKGILVWNGPGSLIHLDGNLGPGKPDLIGDEWDAVTFISPSFQQSQFESTEPPFPLTPLAIHHPDSARSLVLEHAGATVPARDAVDQRIVTDVVNGTGSIVSSQDLVGGWPTYAVGSPEDDSDLDGMPDSFELNEGLDPFDPGDAVDLGPDGYTWIEVYANGLFTLPGDVNGDSILSPADVIWSVGTGCGAAPTAIEATGSPAQATLGNSSFGFRATGAIPALPVVFAVGLESPPLPIGPGCSIYFDPAPFLVQDAQLADAGGEANSLFPIPASPNLEGLRFTAHAVALDPGVSELPISAGLSFLVGDSLQFL